MLRTRELHALLQDVVDAPGECAVDGALLLTEKGSVIATAGSRNQRRNIGHACFRPKGRARVPFHTRMAESAYLWRGLATVDPTKTCVPNRDGPSVDRLPLLKIRISGPTKDPQFVLSLPIAARS